MRGGASVGGARHLDRGINSASYYGRRDAGTDSEHEFDPTAARQLGKLEAGINGTSGVENPVCLVHGEPCIILASKKPGKNQGREFFKCGRKQRYEQCDFFQWADEPPKLFSDAEQTEDDCADDAVEVPPVFDVQSDGEPALRKVLRAFGHDRFLPGQADAVQLLLSGKSTLALLPTGGGKSLIYQVFAGVRAGLVVVVTPLVSLMLDQLSCLPEELPGACLRSGQTLEVINATEQKLREGKIKVLFISPERLFSSRFRRLMGGRTAPKVSLVVLDEAHCISQWSHNFRTAYLRIPLTLFQTPGSNSCPVFRKDPQVLALTATATSATIRDICDNLRIDAKEAVVKCDTKRDNLFLSLSRADQTVEAKAAELTKILKRDPFATILGLKDKQMVHPDEGDGSDEDALGAKANKRRRRKKDYEKREKEETIGWGSNLHVTKRVRAIRRNREKRQGSLIVYVTKQKDCASVANYLKSAVMDVQGEVRMYHAGLSQNERKKVQKQFERGSVAVLVATIAFGMGLNYSNVCGVIHFDMPSSLEGYWQEIGRAGRDGRDAFCHILFSEYDACRLLSRSHADGIDQSTVRQLMRCLLDNSFVRAHSPGSKRENRKANRTSSKRKRSSIDEDSERGSPESDSDSSQEDWDSPREFYVLTIDEQFLQKSCDIKKETAETICALLESEVSGFRIRKWCGTKYRIRFFSKSPEELLKSTSKALTWYDRDVLKTIQKHAKQNAGQYDLDLASASITEDQVIGSLNRLQAGRHISFECLKVGLQVECPGGVHKTLKKNAERFAGLVHGKLEEIQKIRTQQAQSVVTAFSQADEKLSEEEQSECLHRGIQRYFSGEWEFEDGKAVDLGCRGNGVKAGKDKLKKMKEAVSVLSRESRYGWTVPQTARQIARIMHGLDSASFRAKDWCRHRHWGQFIEDEFTMTKKAVASVLREERMWQKGRPAVG